MPIGVFDSGLGGLTVLRALHAALPNQPFVYLGDNANAPYGPRSAQDVISLTQAGVERLFAAECRLVIVACNTACALALRPLQQNWLPRAAPRNRVLGVFAPIVEVATGRRWMDAGPIRPAPQTRRRILFFSTAATAQSGAFEREAAARASGLEVIAQACPGLVDALERGDRPKAAQLAAQFTQDALERCEGGPPEAAILGCTHYPLAESAFRAALPAETMILSQPQIVAASLARYLERRPEFEETQIGLQCLTTGEPEAISALASRFYGSALRFRGV